MRSSAFYTLILLSSLILSCSSVNRPSASAEPVKVRTVANNQTNADLQNDVNKKFVATLDCGKIKLYDFWYEAQMSAFEHSGNSAGSVFIDGYYMGGVQINGQIVGFLCGLDAHGDTASSKCYSWGSELSKPSYQVQWGMQAFAPRQDRSVTFTSWAQSPLPSGQTYKCKSRWN